MYDCYDDAWNDGDWWEEEVDEPPALVTTPTACESFRSEWELVERGRALNLPDYHFIPQLIAWWDRNKFWTVEQRRSFTQCLLKAERQAAEYADYADCKTEENIVVVKKETSMSNFTSRAGTALVINLPVSLAALLEEARANRQSLVVKTNGIEVELTREGLLTTSVSSYWIEAEPEAPEPAPEPIPSIKRKRPELVVTSEPEVVAATEPEAELEAKVYQPLYLTKLLREQNQNQLRLTLRTVERREALIRFIRARGQEGLTQAEIAAAITQQGIICSTSTICSDLFYLKEQNKINFSHKRNVGRIYSVVETDLEAVGF